MLGLLDAFVDRLADALEKAATEIDGISRDVFRNKKAKASHQTRDLQSLIERIGRKGDLLTMVRESLVSMTRLSFIAKRLKTTLGCKKKFRSDLKCCKETRCP